MASTFTIESTVQILPLEQITFTDTNQVAKGIHSSIDKVFSGSMISSHGSTSTNIVSTSWTGVGTSGTLISLTAALGVSAFTCTSLFVKNALAGAATGKLAIGGTAVGNVICLLANLGDYIFIPEMSQSSDNIYLYESSTDPITYEILYGLS